MSDTVGWGILGTGKIAGILAEALQGNQGARLASVGSRDGERARGFAGRFGAASSGTYEDVLADDAVDLVYVATPHPHHRRWAVAAADARKHVLCEKPMAVNRPDAAAIVDAARRNGVHLSEAFAYRSHPQTERLVSLVGEGAIGEVRMIDAVFGYDAGPDPTNYLMVHDLAGGSILDVGCYTTSMAHLIAGAATDVQVAYAADVSGAGRLGPTGVDLSAAASLRFDTGTLARVSCSIEANLESSLWIYGSEGRILVSSPWLPGRIGDARIVVERDGAEPETIEIATDADVYAIEVDAVSELVRGGERDSPMMTWGQSLENMGTLDRWRRAIGLRYKGEGNARGGG